ncbi:MAG: endonuclease/exonuclease/phosphatase family protein [Phycisphaerales bacterium]|nr:MAG: endonuclease/exonuclease/phosphatase family protein [Phycisphaerales bacterium]
MFRSLSITRGRGTAGFIAAVILAILLLLGGCAAAPVQLRVLSYNIHHGEGMDGNFDLPRLAEVINSTEPDLVSLQEVDRGTTRAGGIDQAAELGRLTGMHVEYGPAMDYAGGEYGVAILSRLPFEAATNHPLPYTEGYEPRTALAAQATAGGIGEVTFIATHLQHNSAKDRLAQAQRICELFVKDDGGLVILAGDLNARPDSPPMIVMLDNWTAVAGALRELESAPTFPSDEPDRKIDYILLRPMDGWRVVEMKILHEPIASDHCPLLAVLEYAGGEGAAE